MKTETELYRTVTEELAWEPSVKTADLAVDAKDGVVTMHGHVGSVREHDDVIAAVQRVAGVKAVADELEVRLPPAARRTDSVLALAVAEALEWNAAVPHERIKVIVKDGWVTLTGEVEWYYQKAAAVRAVRQLIGVKGIDDEITIAPRARADEVAKQIETALRRYILEESHHIRVNAVGSHVTLHGWVRSWPEREQVEHAAWAAPGVEKVTNELTVVSRD